MAKKPKTAVILCIHFMILFCLVSCGGRPVRMNIPEDQLRVATPENKIPLKAGLYLSQVFRTTQISVVIGQRKMNDIHIGDALNSGTEKMMRNLFREVTVLDQLGNAQDSTVLNYDVIVTPQVEQFELRHVMGTLSAHWVTQNTIKWSIVSPEGKEIYQNMIRSDEIKISWFDEKNPEAVIKTLKDQFQKAQEDIYSNGWWKRQWWKDGN
jgi:hypothetical protein